MGLGPWVSVVGQDHGMAAVRLLPFWDNFSGPSDREWSRHSVLSGGLSASCVRSCLRVASQSLSRASSSRTEHSPPGGCRSGELLPSTRSATGELETSDYNYNTVINMSTTGSPTDWRVEKSNTSPHRVGGVLYEPKAFAIAPSFTNANAPFALPAMLGGAMSLFTPISLEAGGGARKIF